MAPTNLCIYCQKQPKYVDGTKIHPFCSKSCAAKSEVHGVGQPAKSITQPIISGTIELSLFS